MKSWSMQEQPGRVQTAPNPEYGIVLVICNEPEDWSGLTVASRFYHIWHLSYFVLSADPPNMKSNNKRP